MPFRSLHRYDIRFTKAPENTEPTGMFKIELGHLHAINHQCFASSKQLVHSLRPALSDGAILAVGAIKFDEPDQRVDPRVDSGNMELE